MVDSSPVGGSRSEDILDNTGVPRVEYTHLAFVGHGRSIAVPLPHCCDWDRCCCGVPGRGLVRVPQCTIVRGVPINRVVGVSSNLVDRDESHPWHQSNSLR